MTNADISNVLLSLAQLLTTRKENPFKIKAYRRAARAIANLPDSVEELVRAERDLTAIPGIGASISGAIREIVQQGGKLQQLESLRADAGSHVAELSKYPGLDVQRVERMYKKLGISSVAELRERLGSGEIGRHLGAHAERHVRQGLNPSTQVLLYEAHQIVPAIMQFLTTRCGVKRAEAAGEYRRRIEVVDEIAFVVECSAFAETVHGFRSYGGATALVHEELHEAVFQIPAGLTIRLVSSDARVWGLAMLAATGSVEHLEQIQAKGYDLTALAQARSGLQTEESVYSKLGLNFIPPELRDGADEVDLAATSSLPDLLTESQICGELHSHTVASDGSNTIEQMAEAAQARGYRYIGITDHSQSLKIAGGVSERDLIAQIRRIDECNAKARSGPRVLKSAEVDILEDGSLDYPDALLKELDYTICSVHSKFALSRAKQTERLLRAMDNRYFHILGHATGRRLLKRPGYEIDFERVVSHAKANGCFFEINSSPERLDLSAENARLARQVGVRIAVNTDAHSTRELGFISAGVEQARRAGLSKDAVLNCLPWGKLQRVLRR